MTKVYEEIKEVLTAYPDLKDHWVIKFVSYDILVKDAKQYLLAEEFKRKFNKLNNE